MIRARLRHSVLRYVVSISILLSSIVSLSCDHSAQADEKREQKTTLKTITFQRSDAEKLLLNQLRDSLGVKVIVDTIALEDEGISSDTPISLDVQGITAKSALRFLLRQVDMTSFVSDGALHLTTEAIYEERLETHLFNVAHIDRRMEADFLSKVKDLEGSKEPQRKRRAGKSW